MTNRIVVNLSTGVTESVPYTPEEEADHAAAVAAQQQAQQAQQAQLNALKLAVGNHKARKEARIARLEKKLYEQLDNDDLGALRTQAEINKLKSEEV
jgi:ribosomal protein S11